MAVDNPKLAQVRLLAAKVETTTGTAIALSGTDATLIVFDPVMEPDSPMNEREVQADLGQLTGTAGAQGGTCTFEVELTGAGAAGVPAWASTFLPACNWANTTGTFAYARSNVTLTIALYEDGLVRTLAGARGTFTITGESGKPARVRFEFKGKYKAVLDASILAPTFPTVIAPICAASTITIGGYSPVISKWMVAANNEVILREDETDATAYRAAAIVQMKPNGSIDPESTSIATRDWLSKYVANTLESFSVAIGSVANNIVTIASSTMQTTKAGRDTRNKLIREAISLGFMSSNPFTIVFS